MSVSRPVPLPGRQLGASLDGVLCDGIARNNIKRITSLAGQPKGSRMTIAGVDQFAVYLRHDGKDQTLAAYGSEVIPALNPAGLAVW